MFSSKQKTFRHLATLGLCLALIAIFASAVEATCVPAYSNETFRRVYRSNKMFFEGLADLTGDGKPDAYGYELQPNNTYKNLVILPNNGSGGFGNPIVITTAFSPADVTVGDLNADGKNDIVVRVDSVPAAIYTFIDNGKGGFTPSSPTAIDTAESVKYIADINNDGRGDLVTSVRGSSFTLSNLNYRLRNTDGTFGAAVEILGQSTFLSPVVGDFDNDGKVDIVASYYATSPGTGYVVRTFLNLGGGFFSSAPFQWGLDVLGVGTVDLNGDGKLDITTAAGAVLVNGGSGVFTKRDLPASPDPPVTYGSPRVLTVDYNGDGIKDIVVTSDENIEGDGAIRKSYFAVYINDGAANFTKYVYNRPYLGTPADMNGDGKVEEVVFVNSTNGQWASATNETAVFVRDHQCTAPPVKGQTKLIDFTGEGMSDIVFWNPDNGNWHYFSNFYERTFPWGGAPFGDKPTPGDFDGDGKTDAAIFRNPTGDWWILRSSDGTFTGTHFGAAGDIPIPADYNGDGKTDIAVFRPSVGDWYIDYSDSDNYTFLHFGANGDVPVPADFDGDGADNICIFRPSDGVWYYLTPTFDNFVGVQWGTNGDVAIPADYDMDGKADIAVYRPSAHRWYILRSYDLQLADVYFGGHDTPMVVDHDGDGVIELAFFRRGDLVCNGSNCSIATGSMYRLYQPGAGGTLWGRYGAANENPIRLKLPN
jgi:hypothetical protein